MIANFSVVAGIGLSAYELNQTRSAILAATYQERATTGTEWEQWLAESDYLGPMRLRMLKSDFDSLSPEDKWRLRHMRYAAIHRTDGIFYQYELGLLNEDYADTFMKRLFEVWVPAWEQSGLVEDVISHMRPSFREEVEKYRGAEYRQPSAQRINPD